MSQYLGQLVAGSTKNALDSKFLNIIKQLLADSERKVINLYVPSTNKLKVNAATVASVALLSELFGEKTATTEWKVNAQGIECSSGVDEQPHGFDITDKGARTRLQNLKSFVPLTDRDSINLFVSMENGLLLEQFSGELRNPDIFLVNESSKEVYIDRCIVHVEFRFSDVFAAASAISEGVTTPKEEVLLAEKTNWSKTAGSFIAAKYKWDAKDWHGAIAGKSREKIMQDAIKSALGLPYRSEHSAKKIEFKADVFHQYIPQSMDFFTSLEISKMLKIEKDKDIVETDTKDLEEVSMWRNLYSLIPQSIKPGADGKSPQNSLGVILTEDIMPVYFDKVDGQDVLHCILMWAKEDGESKEKGWVLPGKRDRAYGDKNPDISIEDANYQLVEKELGITRSSVDYHFILGYFDDRVREQRMRSSGFVSLVVLCEKPALKNAIGVPMNILMQLVRRECRIPRRDQLTNNIEQVNSNGKINSDEDGYRLVRNHDSLLLNIFETTRFYKIMENLKMTQCKWNQNLLLDKNSPRPDFPEFDPGHECTICCDLLVSSKIICKNGHTVCGLCAKTIKDKCHLCRERLLQPVINNLSLDQIILIHYPKQYQLRHQTLTGEIPRTWKDDPMFQSKFVHYC